MRAIQEFSARCRPLRNTLSYLATLFSKNFSHSVIHKILSRIAFSQKIWIIGQEYILNAQKRAMLRNFSELKPFLRMNFTFHWFFFNGHSCSDLDLYLANLLFFCSPPSIIILNFGGNSIGNTNTLSLLNDLKHILSETHKSLPNTILVYSKIIDF